MYARGLDDGRTLTLGVSGLLWNRSLVMYDRETGSLWSHILGRAMEGPLEGTRLETIPSVMTDWRTWSTRHPGGSAALLSRTSDRYRSDRAGRPEAFALGISDGLSSRHWPYDLLERDRVVNDRWDDRPVVATYDPGSLTARLFDRRVDGRALTFRPEGDRMVDDETGTTWDLVTGRAESGALEGRALDVLPAIISYRDVWTRFHPESTTPRE